MPAMVCSAFWVAHAVWHRIVSVRYSQPALIYGCHRNLHALITLSACRARSLPQLQVVMAEAQASGSGRFGPQHLTHALSRLAKLQRQARPPSPSATRTHQQQQQQQWVAAGGLGAAVQSPPEHSTAHRSTMSQEEQLAASCVARTLERLSHLLQPAVPSLTPRQAAVCLWSLSSLNAYDRHTFDALGSHLAQHPHLLQPCDCDMVMSAFAHFNHYHPALLRHIPDAFARQLSAAKPREVSTVLWGFARLRIPNTPSKALLEAAAQHVMHAAQGFSSQVRGLGIGARLGCNRAF